jgi:penicillin-binding protein 1B
MMRLPPRRTTFQVIAIVVIVMSLAVAAMAFWIYRQSVGKFELRRLSLPTRVFADYTPLRGGVPLAPDDLIDKLRRLGYRQQAQSLAQPGDFVAGKSEIDVFTRAFTHPSGSYPSQRVRVRFRGSMVDAVVSMPEGRSVDNAAIEPELLTSILSDQLENRRPVTLDQVPKHLQGAVIATEDIRFWYHPGIDPIGIFRALFRNVRARGVAQGGSTLTQQLVKNYYLTSERTFRRKIMEGIMAVILDAKYSKREILEAYLNDIYLGRNRSISIMGVGEAAHYYFGKPVSSITVSEAALLASMIRSPNNYSPFVSPARALTRRNTVLHLMLEQGKIDKATYDQAVAAPLPNRPFRDRVGLTSIPFYVDRVLQEMSRDYGIKDVKGRGLQIYTAIDLAAQDTAARTLEGGLSNLERSRRRLRNASSPLQGVIIHVDVPTGEIRALVGGRNYDLSQFNRALNARRQVGSLFKPFVYLTAFEPSLSGHNITPATLVSDTRMVLKRSFSADWSPRNYQDEYHGTVTVQEALEQSMNSATVRVGLACGISSTIKTAHTLGVTSDLDDSNPSIVLGAVDLPPIEMADSFSTIARLGSRLPLRTIRFVTDDRGKVVSAGDAVQPVQVFPARDVYVLLNVMKAVLDRGTAAGARDMGFQDTAAGKTGTTNDARDAWFIGFTPGTLALTWVGFDDNSIVGLSGGQAAVPIWTRYMQAVTAGHPNADWIAPGGIVTTSVDEASGGTATPNCPARSVVVEAFKDGTQPTTPCPLHSPQAPPLVGVDQFGNPIALDTAVTTTDTALGPLPPTTTQPGSTLTGGVFKTDTTPAPPPASPEQPRRPPSTDTSAEPPPATSTSAPPPSTNTSAPTPPP